MNMQEICATASAHFEGQHEIILESSKQLNEIGQLKTLGADFKSVLATLFMPFTRKTLKFNYESVSCSLGKFMRRFKVTSNILDPLKALIDAEVSFVLAGGKMIDFCNNLSVSGSTNDYDLFFMSKDSFLEAAVRLKMAGYDVLSEKNHVVEMFHKDLGIKIQLVKTLYSCPEDIIENFDIRACAVAFADNRVWWIKGTLKDIKNKKLVVMNIRPYKLAWVRPLKYYSRGYTIAPTDLALISISYLMSMENDIDLDHVRYFLDRTYQHNSALDESEYDHFHDED